MEAPFSQVAATALINLSLAWVAGLLAARFWLSSRTASWQQIAANKLSRTMPVALIVCVIGMVFSMWSESAVMADVAWLDAGPAFYQMLVTTHYGHAGLAVIALLVAALVAHWRLSPHGSDKRYVVVIAALIVMVAIARVSIGHAFEYGLFSLAVAVEVLHILLMALWVGAVFVAGWMVLPVVQAHESCASIERARYLNTLSDWATVALVGIVITGAYNAYRVLGSPRDLVDGFYGYVLLFKLGCVLIAIALGGFNKFYGLRAALSQQNAISERGLRIVVSILRIESITLLLAIIAAAVLTSSMPPGSQ